MADIVAGAWRLQTIWQAFSGLEADFSAGRSSASVLHLVRLGPLSGGFARFSENLSFAVLDCAGVAVMHEKSLRDFLKSSCGYSRRVYNTGVRRERNDKRKQRNKP
jgi:hypothetical protein